MTDQDVRDFLERMAAEEPTPFLDAEPLAHRARRRAARTVIVGAIGILAAIAVLSAGVAEIRSTPVPADTPTPNQTPSADLGIFAPVAGRIVYGDRDGIWGVDPTAPAGRATKVQLTSEPGDPLGWSSDGTRLLIMQMIRGDRVTVGSWDTLRLLVLDADGSETQVAERQGGIPGATISPDGSRVVFSASHVLYSVDVGGGPPIVLLGDAPDAVYAPTFSPDGAKIAYVVGSGDHSHRVWVMNADGSDAHQILANGITEQGSHVLGLAWSPVGDRIAFGNDVNTYTFAPDGSGFTQVCSDGTRPYWSPDGSQIACSAPEDSPSRLTIVNADGSGVPATFSGFPDVPTIFLGAASGPWHPGVVGTDEPAPTPLPAARSDALAYEINGDIYVADADGSDPVQIADGVPSGGGNNHCANGEQHAQYDLSAEAWSPDGRHLAYWDHGCPVPPGAWGTVLIADSEGTLMASFPGEGWANSWSPDSTRVAVWDSWGGPADATIGVYGLDGVRQALLTVPRGLMPSGDQSPVWSRDGSSILLPGLQVPLDGSAPQQFDTAYPGYPVYSPDGSSVAYLDQGSLVIADADVPDALEMDPPEIWDAAWSPNGGLVAFVNDDTELLVRDVATGADTSLVDVPRSKLLTVIEFSPDGSRILFTRWNADNDRSSLWSIGADGSDLRRLVDGVGWGDLQPQGRTS